MVPPVSYGDGISDAKCVVSGPQMDYRRFQNQAQLACYTNERDAIRAYDAATPITTNLMGTFKDLDYFEWAKEMDVVSWDNYGFQESFAASLTCISNVGPGLGILGPMENFSILSPLSKLVLSLEMLMGRLELMPLLALFLGSTWRD